MKKQNTTIAGIILIFLVSLSSCTKTGVEEQKNFLLGKWKLEFHINSKQDTTFAASVPCLQDDLIMFYENNVGHVIQGDCIYYPGQAKDAAFRFEQVGFARFKLTSYQAGVYADGVTTWFNEGYRFVDVHGEGEFLYIVETSPSYQEWKYSKIRD